MSPRTKDIRAVLLYILVIVCFYWIMTSLIDRATHEFYKPLLPGEKGRQIFNWSNMEKNDE